MLVSEVTVGWFPRERFEIAEESLTSLLRTIGDQPLVLVDAGTPRDCWARLIATLGSRPATIIDAGRPVLPATAKNLVLDHVDTAYVALVENDVLFPDGWVEAMLEAARSENADVVAPAILDGRGEKEHFDKHLGAIVESQEHPGKIEVLPLTGKRNEPGRRLVDFVEQHCLLFRTDVFERIGRFDESLNTRDEVDLSLALHASRCRVVLDADVRVNYVPPTWRPSTAELSFFRLRWDLARAEASRVTIRDRWNLVDTPGDLGFVRYRNLIARLPEVRDALVQLSSQAGSTILLEDGDWFGTEITEGLRLRPFPDLDGIFGGFPASDELAVAALNDAIADGVRRIVVGFPAFWWSDHLPALWHRMFGLGALSRSDDLLIVLELDAVAPERVVRDGLRS